MPLLCGGLRESKKGAMDIRKSGAKNRRVKRHCPMTTLRLSSIAAALALVASSTPASTNVRWTCVPVPTTKIEIEAIWSTERFEDVYVVHFLADGDGREAIEYLHRVVRAGRKTEGRGFLDLC